MTGEAAAPHELSSDQTELKEFLDAFEYHTKDPAHTALRKKKWRTWDPNGNGYGASLPPLCLAMHADWWRLESKAAATLI